MSKQPKQPRIVMGEGYLVGMGDGEGMVVVGLHPRSDEVVEFVRLNCPPKFHEGDGVPENHASRRKYRLVLEVVKEPKPCEPK